MSEFIYFAKAGDRIKIGISAGIEHRLREVGNHLATPIVLLATVRGGPNLEFAIHQKLKPFRIKREWFRDCEEVRAVMNDVIARGPQAVIEHYEYLNQAHAFAGIVQSTEDACRFSSPNPWISMLKRIDDLRLNVGSAAGGKNPDGYLDLVNAARAEFIKIYERALRAIEDVAEIDEATALIDTLNIQVNKLFGREIFGIYSAAYYNRRRDALRSGRADAEVIQFYKFGSYLPFAGTAAGILSMGAG